MKETEKLETEERDTDEIEVFGAFDENIYNPDIGLFGEETNEAPAAYDNEKRLLILIIYDIIEDKKRVKLAKLLEGYGFRIQKSVFEAKLSHRKYKQLTAALEVFKGNEDSIRVYRLTGQTEVTIIGKNENHVIEDIVVI